MAKYLFLVLFLVQNMVHGQLSAINEFRSRNYREYNRDSLKNINIDSLKEKAYAKPNAKSALVLANHLIVRGKLSYGYYDSAAKVIEHLLDLQPELKAYPDFLFLEADANLGRWHIEKAIPQFLSLIEVYKDQSDDGYNIALVYEKIGGCYKVHKNDEQALEYYQKSLQTLKCIQSFYPKETIVSHVLLAQTQARKGLVNDQIQYLIEALEVDKTQPVLNIIEKHALYNDLANAYMKVSNTDSAFNYYRKSIEILKDPKHPEVFFYFMAPSNTLLSSMNSMIEIKEYESSKTVQALEKYNSQYKWASFLLGISLLLLIFLTMVYIKMTRINVRRKLENIQAVVLGEEKERERIAKDLHDEIGVRLTNIRLILNKQFNPEIKGHWSKGVFDQLDSTYRGIRRIAQNLLPENLEKLGLKDALLDLLEEVIHNSKIRANYDIENLPPSDKNKELLIYRIIQELINNSLKHSQANNIFVKISHHMGSLKIEFRDDGIGFDNKTVQMGIGLKSIQTRVDLLKGTINIDNNNGTSFKLLIPDYAKNKNTHS
tara:strand:- start:773 stop:2407 length:1635 start_codon:yes stop_codon:yes gene_type:complete